MINIERIKWMYENFGLEAAIKSACIDIVALFAYRAILAHFQVSVETKLK